jgi:hypothetical protein
MRHTATIALLLFAFAAFAQTDTVTSIQKKQMPNLATIQTIRGTKLKGWFYKMDNDKIYLLPSSQKSLNTSFLESSQLNNGLIPFDVSEIKTIGLQKKGAAGRGALLGLGIGALTGVIIGFAEGDDPVTPYTGTFGDIFIAIGNAFAMTAEEKAAANGIALGVTGALTGYLIGKLTKKKFIIGGNKQVYRDLSVELTKRLILK